MCEISAQVVDFPFVPVTATIEGLDLKIWLRAIVLKKTPNIKYDLYGLKNIQPIWADNFKVAVSNSKMGLNLSQGKSIKYYSSDRITQLIANGLLTFIENTEQELKILICVHFCIAFLWFPYQV